MANLAHMPVDAVFGPVVTVLPAACEFEDFTGEAAIDPGGTIHAFVALRGGACETEPPIRYVTGRGDTWTPADTPYRGHVLAIALDGAQPFLLYANSAGVHIAKQAEDGTFTGGRPVSRPSSPEWNAGQGALVAADDRWFCPA